MHQTQIVKYILWQHDKLYLYHALFLQEQFRLNIDHGYPTWAEVTNPHFAALVGFQLFRLFHFQLFSLFSLQLRNIICLLLLAISRKNVQMNSII